MLRMVPSITAQRATLSTAPGYFELPAKAWFGDHDACPPKGA